MILYKFRSLALDAFPYALDMVVNSQIYLSNYEKMNDPDESVWRNKSYKSENKVKEYLSLEEEARKVVKGVRFTSFTKSYKNSLLWAHYANGFSGACFEYKIDESKYELKEINYQDSLPLLTIKRARSIIHNKRPQDHDILVTKATCWAYEDEVRLFSSSSEIAYIYEPPYKIIFTTKATKQSELLKKIAHKYGIYTETLIRPHEKYWSTWPFEQAIV